VRADEHVGGIEVEAFAAVADHVPRRVLAHFETSLLHVRGDEVPGGPLLVRKRGRVTPPPSTRPISASSPRRRQIRSASTSTRPACPAPATAFAPSPGSKTPAAVAAPVAQPSCPHLLTGAARACGPATRSVRGQDKYGARASQMGSPISGRETAGGAVRVRHLRRVHPGIYGATVRVPKAYPRMRLQTLVAPLSWLPPSSERRVSSWPSPPCSEPRSELPRSNGSPRLD
jgi:hypothetical protein